MSAYTDAEESVDGGAPIECYKFVGTFKTYRYTSQASDIVVGGETYIAVPMRRTNVKAGTQSEDTIDVEIEIPVSNDLVKDYAFQSTPPDLELSILRVQRGTNYATDFIVYWKGPVGGVAVTNGIATLRVPSVFSSALLGSVPSVYYQGPCNHDLYGAMCKVVRAAFQVVTTVTSIGGRALVPASLGGHVAGFFNGGEAVSAAGERRMIVDQSGGTLTLAYEFAGLLPGDAVTISAGCNHSWGGKDAIGDCVNKFNNGINFGGMPLIPVDNPFEGTIDDSKPSGGDFIDLFKGD